MKLLKGLFLIAGIFGLAVQASAGWVQVDREGTTTLISGGMLKGTSAGDDMYSILDAKKGNIIFIDTKRKVYSKETIDEFCEAVVAGMNKTGKKAEGNRGKQKAGKDAPQVSFTKEGDGGAVAGYSTVKYRVLADGKLYEEIWLTSDPVVMKDLESLFRTVMKKFEKCLFSVANATDSPSLSVEDSEEYRKLEQEGWQMRSRNYAGSGLPSTYEVIKLEKKDIPASEFEIPGGYSKIPVTEMLFRVR